jgi:hypothetical protein
MPTDFGAVLRYSSVMIRRIFLGLALLVLAAAGLVLSLGTGWFGSNENAGTPQAERVLQSVLNERRERQVEVAPVAGRQILFGDLHVHSTFTYDAFVASLPGAGGESGPRSVADACDFARYCSALDFWSVTDHAEQLTPRMWRETVETVGQCNALAGSADNPDLVTFPGWGWNPTGPAATGHHNVILTDAGNVPAAPIAAPAQGEPLPPIAVRGIMALANGDTRTLDLNRYLWELDAAEAVKEVARDPDELSAKLDELGLEALLLPRGGPRFSLVAGSGEHTASPGSGGVLAVHARSRRREDIREALGRGEAYVTTGSRMLLWFDLEEGAGSAPMGSRVERAGNPRFSVRAVGSFEQQPGCPIHAVEAAGHERLESLCRNRCYNPGDKRRPIERIEIVRVRWQGEAIDPLVEDAWQVWECPAGQAACEFTFSDAGYGEAGQDIVYYARVIEAANPGPGAAPVQHRAWSSPIIVNFAANAPR